MVETKINPILAKTKKAPEPSTTFVPPPTSLTHEFEPGKLLFEDLELPPLKPHMSEEPINDFITEHTQMEIQAGKVASKNYEKRRQAEIDYAKNFQARKIAKVSG